ncbi:MAG: hypothetical protein L0Z68_09340 [Gammaproteobacteria bacterium]|nr:hypothetical protein [Gammaproteobacteria bacterium]
MKRIFLCMLVLNTLLSGVAWAAHSCPEAIYGHQQAVYDGDDGVADSLSENSCSHCCHGLTHLLGLVSLETAGEGVIAPDITASPNEPFHSSTRSPPTKPPKSC